MNNNKSTQLRKQLHEIIDNNRYTFCTKQTARLKDSILWLIFTESQPCVDTIIKCTQINGYLLALRDNNILDSSLCEDIIDIITSLRDEALIELRIISTKPIGIIYLKDL